MSSRLTSESRVYADKAKDLNRQVSYMDCQDDALFSLSRTSCRPRVLE